MIRKMVSLVYSSVCARVYESSAPPVKVQSNIPKAQWSLDQICIHHGEP
jgi:hypothetical protein